MASVRHEFQAGETIFREGEAGYIAYFIEEGSVEILKKGADGEDRQLAVVTRGEIIGEMALIDNVPRSASARAVDPVTCIVISAKTFTQMIDLLDPIPRRLLLKFVNIARIAQGGHAEAPKARIGYHGRPEKGAFRKRYQDEG